MLRFTLFTVALVAAAPLAAQATTAPKSITRATFVADAEAEFTRVDTNKDGQMSRAEIETSQRLSATARLTARNKAMFAALDSDKNGQLSQAEFAKAIPTVKADASNVLRVDTNKDGQISLAEHRSAMIETFGKVDANKDGTLTQAEVEAQAR